MRKSGQILEVIKMGKEKSDIVKKYPLITYFMLAYIMTWTIAGLAIVLELNITENPLLFFIGSCGPIFSAVIITGIAIGWPGIRELLSGWLNWHQIQLFLSFC
jgi:hypothetical protein